MWKQGLIAHLGPAKYSQYATSLKLNFVLKDKVQLISELQSDMHEENPMHLIVKWCFHQFPRQFAKTFLPVDEDTCPHCSVCNMVLQRHLRMRPCEHVICEQCCHDQKWETIQCPKCQGELEDMDSSPAVIRQMLATKVYCPNSIKELHLQVQVHMPEELTLGNNKLNFEPKVFEMQDRFNRNLVSIGTQNYARRKSLTHRDQDIIRQITGDNYHVDFYLFQPAIKPVDVPGCPRTLLYKDVEGHLRECPHALKQCQCCDVVLPNDVIEIHQMSCQEKLVACPVCYQTEIKLSQMNEHCAACLLRLAKAEAEEASIPMAYKVDVDVDLKTQAIREAMDDLSNKILAMDTLTQKEVFRYMSTFKVVARDNFFMRLLTQLYKKQLMAFSTIFTFGLLMVSDLFEQYFQESSRAIMITMLSIQVLNLVAFFYYSYEFLRTNQFKANVHKFMMTSYFAQILWFAGLYTTLVHMEDGAFRNLHHELDDEPFSTFAAMLYYSAVISGKLGFGDIYPSTISCKVIAIIQIYYSSIIVIIVFRGLSFFLKLQSIQETESAYKRKKRAIIGELM